LTEVEISRRGQILIILPIILVAISILTGEPYTAITAAFLFSLIFYSRYEITNCSVEIKDEISKDNKVVDEPFKVKHTLRSDRELDLSISTSLNDEFESIENVSEKEVKSNSQISYKVNPKSRGYHKLGKLTVWLYDPLKIYKKKIEHYIEQNFTVQSSREAIKKAKTYSKRSYAEEFVEDPFAFTIRSNEFEGIREFHPGDSLRDIHWKSFSKFQKLMTKVYESISPINTHIFLDCSPSMRRRLPDGTTKLDHSIYISLQMLKNFDIQGHEIGMTAYDHKDTIFHQNPESGEAAFKKLYQKVSELPGAVESKNVPTKRYEDSIDLYDLEGEEKSFAERVGKFINTSSRKHLSGVLSSVDQLRARGETKKLVIIISDLEMQPQANLKAVEYLREADNKVWCIVPFSPWYEITEVDEKTLENAYQEYERLEKILGKLNRLGCLLFELHPDKEGFTVLEERGERKT